MCDVPKSYKEALASIVKLENNFRRHEKSMTAAKEKLDAAKKLIVAQAEKDGLKEVDNLKVLCPGGEVSLSKARKLQEIDNSEAAELLEVKQKGLARELAKYGVTDLRKWLSPVEITSISETSYGDRTVKIKVIK